MRVWIGIALVLTGWASAGVAQAQDPAAADWSGLYFGGGVGGTLGISETSAGGTPDYFTTTDFAQLEAAGDGRMSQVRPSGGIEAGYGWQFGNFLLGVEASANTLFLDDSRSASQIYLSAPPARFVLDQRVEADWQATLRPRLGWAQDNWLAYVSGGLAVTRVTLTTDFGDNFLTNASGHSSNTETQIGWTVGLGGEYALGGHWSLRGDYLYADFGKVNSSATVTNAGLPANASALDTSADLRTHTFLIGLSYHFGGL